MMLQAATVVLVAVAWTAQAAAPHDKYDITPAEHAACDGDAARLCISAYPDEDKLLSCMKSNRAQLTPVCKTTLNEGLRRRHMNL